VSLCVAGTRCPKRALCVPTTPTEAGLCLSPRAGSCNAGSPSTEVYCPFPDRRVAPPSPGVLSGPGGARGVLPTTGATLGPAGLGRLHRGRLHRLLFLKAFSAAVLSGPGLFASNSIGDNRIGPHLDSGGTLICSSSRRRGKTPAVPVMRGCRECRRCRRCRRSSQRLRDFAASPYRNPRRLARWRRPAGATQWAHSVTSSRSPAASVPAAQPQASVPRTSAQNGPGASAARRRRSIPPMPACRKTTRRSARCAAVAQPSRATDPPSIIVCS